MSAPRPRPKSVLASLARLSVLAAVLACVGPFTASAGADVKEGFGLHSRGGAGKPGALQYHGGPVLHSSDVYVVYWDPAHRYRGDWERLIDGFFANLGQTSGELSNALALDTQYSDSGGHVTNQLTFRGSYKDEDAYPTTEEGGNCTQVGARLKHGEEPETCLTDKQVRAELEHVIHSVAPPLPGATGTPIYYILTPPGVNVCTTTPGTPSSCAFSKALGEEEESTTVVKTGLCGYHSFIEAGGGAIVPYVVQPWVAGEAGLFLTNLNPTETSPSTPGALACQAHHQLSEPNGLTTLNPFGNYAQGLADVIINDLSIEQRDVVTDPALNAWYQTSTGAEQGDMAQFAFGPTPEPEPQPNKLTHAIPFSNETIGTGTYLLSWGFNSTGYLYSGNLEAWSGLTLEPFFTAANPVNVGDMVGFNATESNMTLLAPPELPANEPFSLPVYGWNFGDGSSVSGTHDASVFHSYAYGGTYKVTLTLTDSGNNTRSTSREITVVGPAAPGSTTGGASVTVGGPGGASAIPASLPTPVAAAAVISRSLRKALRKGIVVDYSINEQVAGRFEVLVPMSLARRLRLSGETAKGLPAGSQPQLVVARVILVASHGGHSQVVISLSKRNAQRLGHLRRVAMMLRMSVRNAARNPASTTVLTTFTLR